MPKFSCKTGKRTEFVIEVCKLNNGGNVYVFQIVNGANVYGQELTAKDFKLLAEIFAAAKESE